MELSKNNVDFIKIEVQKEKIKFSHLQDDLIDHICTQVEIEMESGLNFGDAYKKVKNTLNFKNFKNIEVDTLISLNQYLTKTKKRANIIGTIAFIITIVGIIFKIQHILIGGYLLYIGIAALAIGYIPQLLVYLQKNNPGKNKKVATISGIIAALIMIICYTFSLGWPLRSYFVVIGYFSILTFLIFYFLYTIKLRDKRVFNLSIIFFLFIILVFDSTRFFYSKIDKRKELYASEQVYDGKIDYYQIENLKLIKEIDHPNSSNIDVDLLNTKTQELQGLINKTLSQYKGANSERFNNLLLMDDYTHFAEEYNVKLNRAVSEYQQYILEIVRNVENEQLETHIKESIRWDISDYHKPTIIAYISLKNLQSNILEVQNEILANIYVLHLSTKK